MTATTTPLLELVRYRAWFETHQALHLADYPGSMWRGALGHAVKSVACTHPKTPCGHCPERQDCPYPPLFDTPENGQEPLRPYILEPHIFKGYLLPGSLVGLDFILYGWANNWLPLWADALEQLGKKGLGVRQPTRLTLADLQQQVGPERDSWLSIMQPGGAAIMAAPLEQQTIQIGRAHV